jgi:carboxypeptidase family protein
MRCLVTGVWGSALALALVGGLVGVSPAMTFAQQAPVPETLVARCDLPVVDLFNPLPGDVVQPGAYLISGLALDPMADPSTSGIDQVAFFLGDRDQGGQPLGTVVPNGGVRQADFTLTVTLPSASQGTLQQLQAFARSALSGKETEVSTPIMLGQNPTPGNTAGNVLNTNPGVLPNACSVGDALTAPPATPAPTPAGAAPASTPAATPLAPKPAPNVGTAPLFATIIGSVSACQGGVEQPVTFVNVEVQGTPAAGFTDASGVFAVSQVPAPGTYTITVSDGGQTAVRQYVPVAPGETIDIGPLLLGADVTAGCGEGLPPTNQQGN